MTKLNYLKDTYLSESEATFIELRENEKGRAVILDETIFYPQGGGQPADRGEITSGESIFAVNDARLDENGVVWHFGDYKKGEFKKGDRVNLKIDKSRRGLNTKLHSSGHLIACAVSKSELKNLQATKGFHFPEGPYVEFEGSIENPSEAIPVLQKIIDDLVSQNLKVTVMDLNPEEAKSRAIYAPPGKSARVVCFAGLPAFGCGGTHVNSTSEIGKITIRKIKSNQGKTKISYSVE